MIEYEDQIKPQDYRRKPNVVLKESKTKKEVLCF